MMNNLYTVDEFGKEVVIDKTNYQVMMEWEKPYMKALVDNVKPTGDVLEIGFGLGYSSSVIQSYNINSHTIIECDPTALELAEKWAKEQKHKVILVEGTWQDKLKTVGKFDTIFFDDSPHEDHVDPFNIKFYKFYYDVLRCHVNPSCRLTWYCDYPMFWIVNSHVDWSCKEFPIDIPENCNYVPNYAKNIRVMYMPVLSFPYGNVDVKNPIALDKFFNAVIL